jgi:putative ABC transport system ATP-binding protein
MNETENNNLHLELKDVWKIYKDGDKIIHSLSRINCSFERGSFNIIHGPSGSGKSTLIRILSLLESPTMGKVLINGKDTAEFPQEKRNFTIRNDIGLVFHSSNLIPTLNALDNLTLPMFHSNNKIASELLEKVGFINYNKFPHEMSVEEEQRVSIARAMVNNHSIILLDEPTGDLHTDETENIMKLLLELNQTRRLTIVITTNNRNLLSYGNPFEMVDGTFLS